AAGARVDLARGLRPEGVEGALGALRRMVGDVEGARPQGLAPGRRHAQQRRGSGAAVLGGGAGRARGRGFALEGAAERGLVGPRRPAGAHGLKHVVPATAAHFAESAGEPRPVLTDARTSLRLGARYLRRQLDRFGGKEQALAAYNAGPERVRAWLEGGVAPGA